MITGVTKVVVPVDDQERAKDFWTTVVGFGLVRDETYGDERWVEVEPPDRSVVPVLSRRTPDEPRRQVPDLLPHSNVFFNCEDIEETYAELSERGVRFPAPPAQMHFGWWSGAGSGRTGTVRYHVDVADNGNINSQGLVHHRCITATALDGLRRDRWLTLNRLVEPKRPGRWAVGRRIRLRGLLRKRPAFAGLFYSRREERASPVHHEMEKWALQTPSTERDLARKVLG